MVGREANVAWIDGRTLREIEPVLVHSNEVSSNKNSISKMHEETLSSRMLPLDIIKHTSQPFRACRVHALDPCRMTRGAALTGSWHPGGN
jgi:hypothetical protein